MGDRSFSRAGFATAQNTYVPPSGSSTFAGEERVRRTGKLDPLVDPAEYGVTRRSLIRFEEITAGPYKGMWRLTIGPSKPVEHRYDTTGSMGDNVERVLYVLPDSYELTAEMLPGFDLHLALGIFGDCADDFVLCRPQYEMEAEKIVHQLTLMNPEHGGAGNGGEDPHYGIFGGAYLVAAYANRIGLMRYDFTTTDEPARHKLRENQLIRVFGPDVFDKVAANGHNIDRNDLPSTKEVVQDLLQQAHAFVFVVGNRGTTRKFWTDVYGPERVIEVANVDLLAYLQAVVVGLTEGTFALDQVADFLAEVQVPDYDSPEFYKLHRGGRLTSTILEAAPRRGLTKDEIKAVCRSVANIPIGAEVPFRQAIKRLPQAGDIFKEKTDLWPTVCVEDIDDGVLVTTGAGSDADASADDGPNWQL